MKSIKQWLWTGLIAVIASLFLVQFANGIKYTYYSINDINHAIYSDVADCVVFYGFFSMEMSCVNKSEVK